MKQYIVNLTDHLIHKNRYSEILRRIRDRKKFIEHVKNDLDAGDVRAMSPAKLGEIMCSFEIGDVMVNKKDLFDSISFYGNCNDMLRELVSLCLASAISERLSEVSLPGIPKWEGRTPRPVSGVPLRHR